VSSGSLYGVLGLSQTATADEIKSGFRRMARQWHPDVCHEDNAQEMFMRINKAYETLSDQKMRVRYDAGLQFEAISHAQVESLVYIPPLRCGMITGQVKQVGKKSFIETIEDWQDIVVDGQVLVTSWNHGLEKRYVRIIGR
jgi:DnaJ-class molecular chaperone